MPSLPDNLPDDMATLKRVSADIGSDPMLVQSAGGNTSLKEGGVMWIKASGTLLADAMDKDIFVAVDLAGMRNSISKADPIADQPQHFLIDSEQMLRPSIETSLHAIFEQRVVMHVHCVHTLAHAIRQDAQRLLDDCLDGLDWVMVPYAKPGASLAKTAADALKPDTTIVVLANHGLLVAADSVEQAEADLRKVHERLAIYHAPATAPQLGELERLAAGSAYCLPEYSLVHQLALDTDRIRQAATGSLYPDHVIFCGVAVTVLGADENLQTLEQMSVDSNKPVPVFVLVRGAGVLVRHDASSGALALMRCLADVLTRVPSDAQLVYLSDDQNAELLSWDAEKYRQSLNA